jgi:hypothetical protein
MTQSVEPSETFCSVATPAAIPVPVTVVSESDPLDPADLSEDEVIAEGRELSDIWSEPAARRAQDARKCTRDMIQGFRGPLPHNTR